MTFNQAIGKAVLHYRRLAGLSQDELAYRAGVDRTYIGILENAQSSPTTKTLHFICQQLNIKMSDLMLHAEALLQDRAAE